MKSLTPKQRGEIYLKVAEMYEANKNHNPFLCTNLCDAAKIERSQIDCMDTFPEFSLFKPNHDNAVWFFQSEGYARESRITCMLLCYEMTKTQTT